MPEPQAIHGATEATAPASPVWGFLATALGVATAWLAKLIWQSRPRRAAPVTHDDIQALKDLVEEVKAHVAELRTGQEARGEQMAAMEASVASKQDLYEATSALSHDIQAGMQAASTMMLKHLENHPQRAA